MKNRTKENRRARRRGNGRSAVLGSERRVKAQRTQRRLSPAQFELLFAGVERNADTTIRAAIAAGQPGTLVEPLVELEMTLAATLARLCVLSDFVPCGIDQRVIVSVDDYIELLGANTRMFYRRALGRLPKC